MNSNLYNNYNKYNNKYESDTSSLSDSSSSSISYSDIYQPYNDDNESVFSKLSDITDLSYNNDYNHIYNYNEYDDYSASSSLNSTPRIKKKKSKILDISKYYDNPLLCINEYNNTDSDSSSDSCSMTYDIPNIDEIVSEYKYNTIWNIYNTNKYSTFFNNISLNILSLFSRLILFIINPFYIFNENLEINYRNLTPEIDEKTKLILLNEEYNNYKKLKIILLFYAFKIPTFFVISNIHFDRFYTPLLKYIGFISDTSNISIIDEFNGLLYDINYNHNKKINLLLMSNYDNLQVCKVFSISNYLKSGIINIFYDVNNCTVFNSYEYDDEEEIINDIDFYNKENENMKLIKNLRFINILNNTIIISLRYILVVIAIYLFLNMLNIIQTNYINTIFYYTLSILKSSFSLIKNNLFNNYNFNYTSYYTSNTLFDYEF